MNNSRRALGCVIIPIIFILICGGHPFLNWLKWKLNQPESYLIRISEFRPPGGDLPYQVKVEHGTIKEVAISSVPPRIISNSKGITVDSLFLRVPACLILMPFGLCELEFDAEYGYPQSISYSWGGWINVDLLEIENGTE